MGFSPPVDAPSPSDQAGADASASFEPSPSGATLCGFGFPSFSFSFALRIPKFPPFPFPPTFNFFIQLNCDLSKPIDAGAGFDFGGGRVGSSDPDADDQSEEDL